MTMARPADRQRAGYVRHVREHGHPGSAGGQMGGPAEGIVNRVLTRGAGRVTGINETTRKELRQLIAQAIEQGLSPREAGDLIQAATSFSEYRAERIATTEMQFAYNQAALQSYGSYGVTQVQAIDGDDDEECAERDGQIYSVDEADGIEDHPNGTLDWLPLT